MYRCFKLLQNVISEIKCVAMKMKTAGIQKLHYGNIQSHHDKPNKMMVMIILIFA